LDLVFKGYIDSSRLAFLPQMDEASGFSQDGIFKKDIGFYEFFKGYRIQGFSLDKDRITFKGYCLTKKHQIAGHINSSACH